MAAWQDAISTRIGHKIAKPFDLHTFRPEKPRHGRKGEGIFGELD
jgi:hypothetical protein